MTINAINTVSSFIYNSATPLLSAISDIGQSTLGQASIALTALVGINYLARKLQTNLKDIPEDNIEALANYLDFNQEDSLDEIEELLKKIKPEERKKIINYSKNFFYYSGISWKGVFNRNWDEGHALEVLQIIFNTPKQKRKILLNISSNFIYQHELSPDQVKDILKNLQKKTTEEIIESFEYAERLLPLLNLAIEDYTTILFFISELPSEKKMLFLRYIEYWTTKNQGEPVPASYLNILSEMFTKIDNAIDLNAFFDSLNIYYLHYPESIKNGNILFLQALMEIDPKDREKVFRNALFFFGVENAFFGRIQNDELQRDILIFILENKELVPLLLKTSAELWDAENKLHLINQLLIAPKEERLELLEFAWRLMRQHPKGGLPGNFIEKLALLPRAKRAKLVELAERIFPFLEGQPFSLKLLERFIDLGDELPSNIDLVIDRSMSLQEISHLFFPAPGQMTLAAQNGESSLDVHEGNRDEKTRHAFFLLHNATQSIDLDKTEENARLFLEILEKYQLDQAIFLLTEHDPSSSFSAPFLAAFSLFKDTKTSGIEIIGRLYEFISHLDSSDMGNALESMINVLNSDECAARGARKCPPGIVERLFVAVLQGRLKHVQIDEPGDIGLISINERKTKDEPTKSLNDFFSSPEHREITDYEKLINSAENFYQNNQHKVNREQFFKKLDEYAIAQDIKQKN